MRAKHLTDYVSQAIASWRQCENNLLIPYSLAHDTELLSQHVAATPNVAAKIGQQEFLPSFRCQKPRLSGCTQTAGSHIYRLPRVFAARTDAQVPHFRDGPFGETLRSANIWTAHPDRPVSCEENRKPRLAGFFCLEVIPPSGNARSRSAGRSLRRCGAQCCEGKFDAEDFGAFVDDAAEDGLGVVELRAHAGYWVPWPGKRI